MFKIVLKKVKMNIKARKKNPAPTGYGGGTPKGKSLLSF